MNTYESEIDLRPYILTLINNWRRIGLLAAILAIIALGYSLLMPRVYIATATILLTRSQASLILAEQFPTVRENIYDSNARMDALLSIAGSDAIAFESLKLIGNVVPEEARELEDFKDRVEVSSKGDSIIVSASAESPQLSADIANTWARQSEQTINRSYSGDQPLEDLQSQVVVAKQDYDNAQVALESFIEKNRITILESRIAEAKSLLSETISDRSWQISNYYYRKQAMQNLKIQAEALISQLQNGSRSTAGSLGDAIAILNARARFFGIGQVTNVRVIEDDQKSEKFSTFEETGPNFDLQLADLNNLVDTNNIYRDELEILTQQAEDEILKANQALENLSREVIQGQGEGDENVELIGEHIRNLEAQLESQKALQQELTSARDLTWEAYQALVQKETEIKNAAQSGNQVILASQAIPPQKPASRGTVRNTLVAGMLGLILGVFWVFFSMWWRSLDQPAEAETSLSAAD